MSLATLSDSFKFQCVAGMRNFLHLITCFAYIIECGMRVSLLAISDSLTFLCASGACHFVYPVTRLNFSVRQACVASLHPVIRFHFGVHDSRQSRPDLD